MTDILDDLVSSEGPAYSYDDHSIVVVFDQTDALAVSEDDDFIENMLNQLARDCDKLQEDIYSKTNSESPEDDSQ